MSSSCAVSASSPPASSAADKGGARVEIDSRLCKSCGLCVNFCPKNVLRIGDRINAQGYRAVSPQPSGCIGCGICLEVCPEPGVITLQRPVPKATTTESRTKGLSV